MKKNITLVESVVSFDATNHVYYLDGKKISGVTPIIDWLYPRTYDGIPQEVMDAAAARGTKIHLDCQMSDFGFTPTAEAVAYQRLKAETGLTTLANEWLVDDGAEIASKIDVVFDDFSIADIKTTSQIHEQNVRMQLSIYAMLLEGMNEGLVVPRLFVIWLPKERYGKPEIRQISRIEPSICAKVVEMYLGGREREEALALLDVVPSVVDVDTLPAEFFDAEKEVARLEMEAKAIKERQDALRDGLKRMMEEHHVKSYKGAYIEFTYVDEYERESVDTARLKKERPDVYSEFRKISRVKSTIQMKVKKQK